MQNNELTAPRGWQCVKDDADEARIDGASPGRDSELQHRLRTVATKLQLVQR